MYLRAGQMQHRTGCKPGGSNGGTGAKTPEGWPCGHPSGRPGDPPQARMVHNDCVCNLLMCGGKVHLYELGSNRLPTCEERLPMTRRPQRPSSGLQSRPSEFQPHVFSQTCNHGFSSHTGVVKTGHWGKNVPPAANKSVDEACSAQMPSRPGTWCSSLLDAEDLSSRLLAVALYNYRGCHV